MSRYHMSQLVIIVYVSHYTYDENENRTIETDWLGNQWKYEYDKVVLEINDNGNQTARNVYGNNLISRKVDAETLYYMYNGHADVTALIDNIGAVQASYYYDAFGTPIDEYTNENGKNNPIRYAGYQYDGETGLYYLNARYYDSKIARFLSEDTYRGQANDPLSLNLYTYCHNEPVMYWDPTGHSPAIVTVGGVKVGNADVKNGVTTGNLTDIVEGLGGSTSWNGKTGVATVKMKDADTGKWEATTYNTKTMKDSNGNSFTIVNGKIQVGVRQTANQAGVGDTISWWSDSKKATNVVVQPDMKYAPVKVVREGSNVRITAYVNFSGDGNEIMPSTAKTIITTPDDKRPNGMTYGEVAAKSIMNTWQGSYDVYGQNVNVKTKIYSNNYSPNNILTQVMTNSKQKFLDYKIAIGSHHVLQKFGMRSHEGMKLQGIVMGTEDILKWSIKDSSSPIVVYDHVDNKQISDNWLKETIAHEFGHALGLGDAYNAGYRGGSWAGSCDGYYAPSHYTVTDSYNDTYDCYVPDSDIMLEGNSNNYVYSNDIRMVLDAYRTGKVQLYPWGSKDLKKR